MVKLSRCPLTSQEHDSPTAVRRGERSKEGKRDRSEESWRRNVGIDARSIRPWRGGRPFRGELVRKTRYNTAHGNSGSVTFVARWDMVRGRDAAPRAVHLPGRICTGCCTPLKEGIPAVFPLCLSRLRFSCTPFHGEIGRAGRGGGSLDHCHSPSSLPPLHFSSSKLDKCAPLIILAIDLFPSKQQPPRDSSTLKIEFFLIMVPNETGITRLPSPLFPLPAFQETRCSLPRYQAAALEDR